MVLGWRKAFCTSIPKSQLDPDSPILKDKPDPSPSPRSFARFFSNPSPRPPLRCRTTPTSSSSSSSLNDDIIPNTTQSAPQSPKLQCKIIKNSPSLFHNRSTPSSPRSPSPFSLIKSSIGLSKNSNRCGICLQKAKTGEGTAIFTAECGHTFHFPCITTHVNDHNHHHVPITCPNCNYTWKEAHFLQEDHHQHLSQHRQAKHSSRLKVYNDDEPLSSPTSGARFNPIPESEDETDEFPGFFVTTNNNNNNNKTTIHSETKQNDVAISLSPEIAVISVTKNSQTQAVVLKVKAPVTTPSHHHRSPIDLVTVIDVSCNVTVTKLHMMKKAMRLIVSSLSSADRLSIVAFSTASKRLLPLRRMNTAGRRSARRIIDAIVSLDDGACGASAADSVKKAVKVMEDRRERNPAGSILVFCDGYRRFTGSDVAVECVDLGAWVNAPPEEDFRKYVTGLLRVGVKDLKVQVAVESGSGEVTAVYSCEKGESKLLGFGSSWCGVGDLHPEEERELLIELKVPSLLVSGSKRLLSVGCSYIDPSTQQFVSYHERAHVVPRPEIVGSTLSIQRLKCLFVATRAVAESRRLIERNDVVGAYHMLASARALILHNGVSGQEFVRGLEVELAELKWKRKDQLMQPRRRNEREADEKVEPLTPTSAWRAAERLAKVAMVRKSLNRVSDLHGFENARF